MRVKWQIELPDVGELLREATVIEVPVRKGHELKEYDTYLIVEGDKATVELPSPYHCTVERALVRPKQIVRSGDPLLAVNLYDSSNVGRAAKLANVRTALALLAGLSVPDLCRPNGQSVFPDLEKFFDNAVLLSRILKGVQLLRLPDFLLNTLTSTLFDVTEPLRQVQLFHNEKGKLSPVDREHRRRRVLVSTLGRQRRLIGNYYEVYDGARRWLKLQIEIQRSDLKSTQRQIFLIHGHDEALRLKVESFLSNQNIQVIVLQDRAGGGLTPMIQSIEQYAGVDFAVALLTPDDLGKKRGEKGPYRPRARQNVVLELGYFSGTLGRERVAALCDPTVDIPSDLKGLRYINVDPGGAWILKLAQELVQAGFGVDLNKLSKNFNTEP